MTAGILNSHEIKSDFNSKMLNFCKGFTSYWTCLESLKKHYAVDRAIHLSYNRSLLIPHLFSEEKDASPSSPNDALEKSLCDRLASIVHVFHELVQSAVPLGSCTEHLLKVSPNSFSYLKINVALALENLGQAKMRVKLC